MIDSTHTSGLQGYWNQVDCSPLPPPAKLASIESIDASCQHLVLIHIITI